MQPEMKKILYKTLRPFLCKSDFVSWKLSYQNNNHKTFMLWTNQKSGAMLWTNLGNLKSDFIRNIHLRLYSGPFGCRVPS